MSEVLVVRHAQASYGKANYDALSALGHEQSRRLGQWLSDHYDGFDALVTGDMVRHRETMDAVLASYRDCDRALCEPTRVPELNEFDHGAVLDAFKARHADHPAARAMQENPTDGRAIYAFLHAGMSAWSRAELDDALAEGWMAFSARIARGRDEIVSMSRAHRRILVVTSGGVLAQLARQSLGLTPQMTVEMNLTIRNSGICEFRRDGEQLRLVSWNALPHLSGADAREMWTHY